MTYHNYIKFFPVILMLVIGLNKSVAQNQHYQSNKIIPPSPTAAALGKYGNIPVSFYNGTPSISIPLYDIQTANHQLKIQMQYDASGTKVSQNASWVGLGWSLSAGGVITRIVRQQDDFIEHGYYHAAALPNGDYAGGPGRTYLNNIFDSAIDAEPDVFSYNFNGYSGRFVLGKKNDGAPVFMDEKNNLKIEYIDTQGKWILTTAEGYKYYFSTSESAQDYYLNTNTEPNITGVQGLNRDINASPITAWYLDSMVAPSGETISFTYIPGKSLGLLSKSEGLYQLDKVIQTDCSVTMPGSSHSYSASRQELKDVYLKTITFATGSVEFNTTVRNDIEYINNNDGLLTPSKLDNIIIRNNSGTQLKKYVFSYGYFNVSPGGTADASARLRLDGIVEYGSSGNSKPPYVFSYQGSNMLPDKNSKSIDHWGYQNSKVNSTLLPTTSFPLAAQSFTGADREADTVLTLPANGVLNKIQYPTGGSTTFEYELHDYSNLHSGQQYQTINRWCQAKTNSANRAYDVPDVSFTINPIPGHPEQKIPVTISCSATKVDPTETRLGYSNMWQIMGDGSTKAISGCDNLAGEAEGNYQYSKNLDPGNYRMYVQAGQHWSYAMSISWSEQVLTTIVPQRKGGGIRVKRITDIDQAGATSVHRYVYTDNTGKSSGVLLTYPKYDVTYDVYQDSFAGSSGADFICSSLATYTALTSSSIYPPGLSSKSGIVGYSKVTELLGENGENGKTEYHFHNQEEAADIFPGIPVITDPMNGKQDSVRYYNAQGNLVKKENYGYSLQENNALKGIKLFFNYTTGGDGNLLNNYRYYTRFYDNNSNWVTNIFKEETIYNGINSVTSRTNYIYGMSNGTSIHRLPTQVFLFKSDGTVRLTRFKRPTDYLPAVSNSFVQQMIDSYVISPVIEEQTFFPKGPVFTLVSGTFTSYKKYNNSFFRPDVIYRLEAQTPLSDLTESSFSSSGQPIIHPNYKPAVYYDLYDNSGGNLLSMHEADHVPQAYFWGYQNQYPVAQVKGMDYTTAKQYVNTELLNSPAATATQVQTEINKIRTATNSQVSTFTFTPLIGMTTSTDAKRITTTYEYDGFQRLLNVKDKDGNIVKNYLYNYAGAAPTAYQSDPVSTSLPPVCGPGYTAGPPVTYALPAGAYTSTISLDDANQKAQADLAANGQTYANAHGTCDLLYYNSGAPIPVKKNNCTSGYTGTTVNYIIPANTYSAASQAELNQKVQNDVNTTGQTYANNNGECIVADAGQWLIGYGINDPQGHTVSITVTKTQADINMTNTVYYRIKMISGGDVTGWFTMPAGTLGYTKNATFSTPMTGNVVSISIDKVY